MRKIRRLYYFDKKHVQEMISFLNNGAHDTYINYLMFNPFIILHHLVPLKWKFLPESYVLKEDGKIKGLITVGPLRSKNKKMEIQKLFFEENSFADAIDLIQFAVSKYKAKGAFSIVVKIDDYLSDLLNIFVTQCGFTQISQEKLWRINKFIHTEYDSKRFRLFRNTDDKDVQNLYNDSLLPHFRPLLGKNKEEFNECIFKGLSYYSEYKYVILDKEKVNLVGYVSILTSDNENYVIDIVKSIFADIDTREIIDFATKQIQKRQKRFGLFIKTKQYVNESIQSEEVMHQEGFECVQNQYILTNSSAQVLKNTEANIKYTVLSNLCPSNPIST